MRIISADDLVFIHIPKCAGKSIVELLPVEKDRFEELLAEDLQHVGAQVIPDMDPACMVHARLGRIHTKHLPLAVMREHFPKLWASLRGSRSFAMLRDPRDRFISAVLQRLREFKATSSTELDDATIAREAEAACEWLDRRRHFCDLEFIHFSPQVDYVFLDGEQIVERCFAVEDFGAAANWLHGEFGYTAPPPRVQNRSVKAAGWFKPVAPAIGRAYKAAIPLALRQKLSPYWRRSGLLKPMAIGYQNFGLSTAVETFIASYYREDHELHRAFLVSSSREAPIAGTPSEGTM